MKAKKKNKEIYLSIRIGAEDNERYEAIAEKLRTTKSALIRTVLVKYAEKEAQF